MSEWWQKMNAGERRAYYFGRVQGLWRCRAEGEYGELGRPVTDRAVQVGLEVLDAVLALDAQPLIYAEDDGGIRFELALPHDDVRIHPRGWAYTLNDDDTEKPFPPEAP